MKAYTVGYRLYLDGQVVKTVRPGSPLMATAPLALEQGMHSWKVGVLDAAGNESWTTARSFRVDTVAPASFELLTPGARVRSSRRPTFSWSASADRGSGLASYRLYIDGKLERTTRRGTRSVRPRRALARGRHTWRVVAVDVARNKRATRSASFRVP